MGIMMFQSKALMKCLINPALVVLLPITHIAKCGKNWFSYKIISFQLNITSCFIYCTHPLMTHLKKAGLLQAAEIKSIMVLVRGNGISIREFYHLEITAVAKVQVKPVESISYLTGAAVTHCRYEWNMSQVNSVFITPKKNFLKYQTE